MTEIHPAPGQRIGEIQSELETIGLVYDRDFWPHYTWDLKPVIHTTEEAYEKWVEHRGGTAGDNTTAEATDEAQNAASSSTEETDSASTRTGARARRTTKGGSQ